LRKANLGKVEIFVGDLVRHSSDQMVLAEVVGHLERLDLPAIVIANLEIGRQLDLVVALDNLTLVIEAKAYQTAIRGSENGLHWEAQTGSGRWKSIGNALQQTLAAKLTLRDKMRAFRPDDLGYPEAALVFCPTIPPGSDIPAGDFKASVCELREVANLLGRPSGLQWPLARWRAFTRSLRLTRVPTVDAACHASLAEADELIASYLSAFRKTYSPLADELLPANVSDGRTAISPGELLERCLGGESILLRGPSGCGKSLLSCWIGVGAADAGRIPLFIYAKDFDGHLGNVLGREATLLGAPSLRVLLAACRRLSMPILVLLDGYNECAEPHRVRLTRGIAALCGRQDANVVATSQISIEWADLLPLTELALPVPTRETKLAIAARQAGGELSPAARAWIDTVKSGLEARVLGDVSNRIAEPGNRMTLFDTYVRARLGASAPAGIRTLIAIARLLAERISFSLSVRDLDRLLDREHLPADIVRHLESATLLTLRGDRASFSHEMYLDAFAAEAVVRDADNRPGAILTAITSPIHARRATQLIGSIDDVRLQKTVLARIEDADIIAGCAAGECGSYAQAWARERIDAILDRAAAEAETIAFAIDDTRHPAVCRIDPFNTQWTAQDRAVIGGLADEFLAGRQVGRMMGIVAALDRKLAAELTRMREELAGRKIGLRSAMFEFCYVHSQGDAPAIGSLLQRLHMGLWPAGRKNRASEIVRAWVGRLDLTYGQLYLLLMLNRMAWDDGPILAPFLPDILRRTYRYAPYHLQLDLLQAAHFSWRANDAEKAAIIDALNELPSDQHIFLSSSVVEALQALGALEESEAEQVEPIRQSVRDLLTRSDADAAEMAYTSWVCRFDHPYASAYCKVFDELAPAAQNSLMEMAGSVAPLDGCFCGILIVDLASFGDQSAAPIVARWLAYPPARCSMPQDAIKYFITAHIALARLICDLPDDRPTPQTPAEEALGACGAILYWLNRIDLTVERRRGECAGPLAILARHETGVATAVLYELGRCYIGEGLDRLPGAMTPVLSLEVDFPGEVAAIYRQCLRSPELQAGYFAYRDLEAILSWAISGLARVGNIADLETLRMLVTSPTLGRTAVQAVSQLEPKLLEVVSQR
jgi:hypothetical protein